jgi:prepilin-type N-terminal cleavage/methylation domain-containing protein
MRVKQAKRGATLVELIVAIAVFSVIVTLVALVLRTGRDALSKTDVAADAFRIAVSAMDQIRREVRGVRVDSVGDGTVLTYHVPRLDDSEVDVLPSGEISMTLEPSKIVSEPDGLVTREDGATQRKRTLARLGKGGAVNFEVVGERLLRVRVRAVVGDASRGSVHFSEYELWSEHYLANQP